MIETRLRTSSRLAAISYPADESKAPSNLPVLPETPWNAIGPVIKEKVLVSGRGFVIERPDRSDQLLDCLALGGWGALPELEILDKREEPFRQFCVDWAQARRLRGSPVPRVRFCRLPARLPYPHSSTVRLPA